MTRRLRLVSARGQEFREKTEKTGRSECHRSVQNQPPEGDFPICSSIRFLFSRVSPGIRSRRLEVARGANNGNGRVTFLSLL